MTVPQSAIDNWGVASLPCPPIKVRYQEFSGDSGWITCQEAYVSGEVLVIDYGARGKDMVPLHIVRGLIEIRPADAVVEL